MTTQDTFQQTTPAPCQSWLSVIIRSLAKIFSARQQKGQERWYDCDGAHRGL